MTVRFALIAGAVCAALVSTAAAAAIETSSKSLIENAKFYDGKTVTYRGEAVTAVMKRGEYAWVNVNDGDNAIGIWCKAASLGPVRFLGGYKVRGDTLVVTGVFNRACQEHGGDLDIHADEVTVAKTGHLIPEEVNRRKVRLAFILFFFTIVIVVIFRKRI